MEYLDTMAFTFAPDGNPLIGPIRGMAGMWSACGVMAGFSQGGGVGIRSLKAFAKDPDLVFFLYGAFAPAGMRLGHRMIVGSRMPPSNMVPLPSRRGPVVPEWLP